jgi:NhaP-type Na+/H+ or K+/H+ antiporter
LAEHTVFDLAAVVILGIGAQWLAWRLHFPSIVLLLCFGFVAGPVTNLLDPNRLLGELFLPVVSLSVAIILFEGGLTLNILDLPQIRRVLINLISVGVLLTWLTAAAAAYLILHLELPLALLLGAILVVSGPTVVLPLLRHVRPAGQVSSILRWEGIVVDPIGAMLAVIVFEAITAGPAGSSNTFVVLAILKTAFVGGILGFLSARLVTYLLTRYWIPDFLHNPVTLTMVLASFTAANFVQPESGLLAVTVMGVFLANQNAVSIKHIIEFKESLRVVILSSVFILLGARLEVDQLIGFGLRETSFLAVLIFVARPVAVGASALRSGLTWRERLFLSWVAPRGIVAAAVASVFALQMREAGYEQADRLVPLTFFVIIGTVVIYGLTATALAHWLRLARSHGQGFVIVGAHSWAREIAKVLQHEGCEVLVIDTNRGNIAAARLAGLPTAYGSIISQDITEQIDLGGMGRLLALTSNDEINALAALHFADLFGRAEVYQLPVEGDGNALKQTVSHHLRGRLLFGPGLTYKNLARRFAAGSIVKKNSLTEEFTFEDFEVRYGENAIPLFVISGDGRVDVATVDAPLVPKPGKVLISIVRPVEETARPPVGSGGV